MARMRSREWQTRMHRVAGRKIDRRDYPLAVAAGARAPAKQAKSIVRFPPLPASGVPANSTESPATSSGEISISCSRAETMPLRRTRQIAAPIAPTVLTPPARMTNAGIRTFVRAQQRTARQQQALKTSAARFGGPQFLRTAGPLQAQRSNLAAG